MKEYSIKLKNQPKDNLAILEEESKSKEQSVKISISS